MNARSKSSQPVTADMAVSKINTRYGDLAPRVIVGVLLIVLAVGASWKGGWTFSLLVAVAVMLIFGEWCGLHNNRRAVRMSGMAMLGGIAFAVNAGYVTEALAALGIVAILALIISRSTAVGILYAGLPAVALIWMRQQPEGFSFVLWTLASVWATDICAYFAGRMIGGPKLAPKISPSKTWAGLVGAMLGAGAVAAGLNAYLDLGFDGRLMFAIGAFVAVAAQVGDFYESSLKRVAGVKDSGRLLPGHGGVMDRLDGLIPVSVLVALAIWGLQ